MVPEKSPPPSDWKTRKASEWLLLAKELKDEPVDGVWLSTTIRGVDRWHRRRRRRVWGHPFTIPGPDGRHMNRDEAIASEIRTIGVDFCFAMAGAISRLEPARRGPHPRGKAIEYAASRIMDLMESLGAENVGATTVRGKWAKRGDGGIRVCGIAGDALVAFYGRFGMGERFLARPLESATKGMSFDEESLLTKGEKVALSDWRTEEEHRRHTAPPRRRGRKQKKQIVEIRG